MMMIKNLFEVAKATSKSKKWDFLIKLKRQGLSIWNLKTLWTSSISIKFERLMKIFRRFKFLRGLKTLPKESDPTLTAG